MKALLYEICLLDALTVNGVRYSFPSAGGSNFASLVNGVTSKQHRLPESPWIVLADGLLVSHVVTIQVTTESRSGEAARKVFLGR